MSSRKPVPWPAPSLAMALLVRLAACREYLKEADEQIRESRDDEEASRIARETIDFLTHWLKSFAPNSSRIPPR
jgi:hypothetical protein